MPAALRAIPGRSPTATFSAHQIPRGPARFGRRLASLGGFRAFQVHNLHGVGSLNCFAHPLIVIRVCAYSSELSLVIRRCHSVGGCGHFVVIALVFGIRSSDP